MTNLAKTIAAWRDQHVDGETAEAWLDLKTLLRMHETQLRRALSEVALMSHDSMRSLMALHRELNDPNGVPVEYAAQLVDAACGVEDDALQSDFDDRLNVLKRVVLYAQYA
ncbi:MAG TPA: hypothetical protein VGM94_01705 [Galbitalea sp.]